MRPRTHTCLLCYGNTSSKHVFLDRKYRPRPGCVTRSPVLAVEKVSNHPRSKGKCSRSTSFLPPPPPSPCPRVLRQKSPSNLALLKRKHLPRLPVAIHSFPPLLPRPFFVRPSCPPSHRILPSLIILLSPQARPRSTPFLVPSFPLARSLPPTLPPSLPPRMSLFLRRFLLAPPPSLLMRDALRCLPASCPVFASSFPCCLVGSSSARSYLSLEDPIVLLPLPSPFPSCPMISSPTDRGSLTSSGRKHRCPFSLRSLPPCVSDLNHLSGGGGGDDSHWTNAWSSHERRKARVR